VQMALEAALPEAIPEAMQQRLRGLWDGHREPLLRSLEVRMGDRTTGLQKALQDRCEKEVADVTAILTELREGILQELQQPEVKQLELFSSAEREQLDRNLKSLEARAAQIPQEIEMETAAVRARFKDPTPRLFPLAITYLIPQKLVK
jgi:SMC interacting uncharacterized protein involved in chromosome segregation